MRASGRVDISSVAEEAVRDERRDILEWHVRLKRLRKHEESLDALQVEDGWVQGGSGVAIDRRRAGGCSGDEQSQKKGRKDEDRNDSDRSDARAAVSVAHVRIPSDRTDDPIL